MRPKAATVTLMMPRSVPYLEKPNSAPKVVAAFALVSWASSLVGLFDSGTDAQVLVLLLMVPLNALLSAIVANVDLAPRADEPREWSLGTWLVLCPCVWCCLVWNYCGDLFRPPRRRAEKRMGN